jgi:hypothetical protein
MADRHSTEAGLCGSCAHSEVIRSDRGSTFYRCGLSKIQPDFPKYPRLPVLSCAGWSKAESTGQVASDANEPMVYCPRCNARLLPERCKLICKRCGYYMSCADYY